MKENTRKIAAGVLVLALLAGCAAAGPRGVAQAFFDKLAEADTDGAAEYMTAAAKPALMIVLLYFGLASVVLPDDSQKEMYRTAFRVKITKVDVYRDTAAVHYRSPLKGDDQGDLVLGMIRTDGKWKVATFGQ